jgi:hypothetical protein
MGGDFLGRKVNPFFWIHIGGVGVDDSTTILLERDSIDNLFVASNIKDRCIVQQFPGEDSTKKMLSSALYRLPTNK